MTSKEALNNIKEWVEYITRLDYVEPEVRGEVKKLLYDAYHKTTPEFKIIEKDLQALEIIKNKNFDVFYLQNSKDLEMYNDACDYFRNLCYLTQEEYDLLKEVLNK